MKLLAKVVLTCTVVFVVIISVIVNSEYEERQYLRGSPFGFNKANITSDRGIRVDVNESKINNDNINFGGKIEPESNTYLFNCNNIKNIELIEKLGQGISKQGYLGLYKGKKVVVKMSGMSLSEVQECIHELKARHVDSIYHKQCTFYPNGKIMKEILILQLLKHQNLVKIIGYCVRSTEMSDSGLDEHGVISVAEFGIKLTYAYLRDLPYRERLRHAQEIAQLNVYFTNSPMGSIKVPDYKLRHFVLLDNHIKMIDMDMVSARIKHCRKHGQCALNTMCNEKSNECENYNAVFNMEKYSTVFRSVFFVSQTYPPELRSGVDILHNRLLNLNISARELVVELQALRDIGDNLLDNT